MSTNGTATIESVRKAPEKKADKKGPEQDAAEQKAPATAPKHAAFFKAPDEDDDKVLKWRFLAKGPALDAILKVFSATAKQGEKQVTFIVPEAGDLELGEVVRHIFLKASEAGVTLADFIALIESKTEEGSNKE